MPARRRRAGAEASLCLGGQPRWQSRYPQLASAQRLARCALGCAVFKQPGDAVAFDDVAFLAGTPITWAGHAGPDQHSVGADAVARRIEGERFATVAAFPQVGQVPMSPAVGVQGGRRARHLPSADWITSVAGRAVAAIGGDFTAVLALDSGRLQVWPPVADAQSTALLGAERELGFVARWVSIVGKHIMLVATDGSGSKLHVYAGDTSALYSVPIPFEVMQPAIAGGGTRVYLAGKGLVALDDGKLTWSQASEGPVYASTFEDGSLAVAAGKRLDFLKPDGTVDQTFNTEEPVVAPPAIAADGSVWAASAEAIYIAR